MSRTVEPDRQRDPGRLTPCGRSSWTHTGHRIPETKHARSKGVVELGLDRHLGVGGPGRSYPCSGDRAAGRANPGTPAAADRPAQPRAERRRQRRRTESAKVSSLHLVRHGLLGELPALA